jgi:hypothetical protein
VSGAFIDGTEDGYLAPAEGIHGGVRFSFQPLLVEERSLFLDKMEKCKDRAQQDRVTAMELEKILRKWDLTKPDGTMVPITAKNILRLKFRLFNDIQAIAIYGTRGSDSDPGEPVEVKLELDRTEVVSAMDGTNLNDAVEEARLKN